jgi:hypothetical protein
VAAAGPAAAAGTGTVVDQASDGEIVALLRACCSARNRLIVLLMTRPGFFTGMTGVFPELQTCYLIMVSCSWVWPGSDGRVGRVGRVGGAGFHAPGGVPFMIVGLRVVVRSA